jgi:ankyrin repeat protein
LNVAVEKDCMECARLMLARGANPRVADSNGRTPEEALRKAGLVP